MDKKVRKREELTREKEKEERTRQQSQPQRRWCELTGLMRGRVSNK